MSIKIAISSGHHNTTGGHADEIALVGPITRAAILHMERAGIDVLSLTPQQGLGRYPGDLSSCARQVVQAAARGWIADAMIEIHGEANGSGDRGRGAFFIFPDWPQASDVDTITRDRLGPALLRSIQTATGLPARGTGAMSERSTSVGASGHRLGIFAATATIRITTRRLIIECGSYTSPADRAIQQAPGFAEATGRAIAEALAVYYGSAYGSVRPPGPASPPAAWRRYTVSATKGAKVRAQPATGSTRTLQTLSYGAPFSGMPVDGEAYQTANGISRAWLKHHLAGYIRADLAQEKH